MRKKASNAFEKNFFKLLNNAIFGKSMENLRGRVNVELIRGVGELRSATMRPLFKGFTIFNQDLVGVNYAHAAVTMVRPMQVGFAILELSKLYMTQFYYEVLKPFYGDRLRLAYTDTDSYILEIETQDIYEDMQGMKEHFDTSNYPPDHPIYSGNNKAVLGKFKDEMGGKIITSFVGLKPKMYALKVQGESDQVRAKGVKRAYVKKHFKHEIYLNCLKEKSRLRSKFNCIRSNKHQLRTITINKIGLCGFDNKRFILDDGITTVPHGHFCTQAPLEQLNSKTNQ
jgi:hypothetical protein